MILCLTAFLLAPDDWMHLAVTGRTLEYVCTNTTFGLTSFVIYIILTSITYAFCLFKYQTLEHKLSFIKRHSACVCLTMLVWTVFIPNAYFIKLKSNPSIPLNAHQFLYSTTLIVNHTIALLSLVVPKVYALAKQLPTARMGCLNMMLLSLCRRVEDIILSFDAEEEL